jgi:putative zinc finger/helix-turn-helix YgiT family protein
MKTYCPVCELETNQEFIQKIEVINVRGEQIPVNVEYYHCNVCEEEYEHPHPGYDPLDQAYREFRKSKGMLQPEEIKRFRKQLGLIQKDFSSILGIGIATLNRYENGSLQSESHDQIIRFMMNPNNLREVLQTKKVNIAPEIKARLMEQLESQDSGCSSLVIQAVDSLASYPANELSGFIQFDITKLSEVVKFFCHRDGVLKTKLMKLLFYSDFHHFKDFGTSITGLRYAHAPFGPVPDQFETWLAALKDWMKVVYSEVKQYGDFIGEEYFSESPDLKSFEMSELQILSQVAKKYQYSSATMISENSHEELGYIATTNGELISYNHAFDLQKLS